MESGKGIPHPLAQSREYIGSDGMGVGLAPYFYVCILTLLPVCNS